MKAAPDSQASGVLGVVGAAKAQLSAANRAARLGREVLGALEVEAKLGLRDQACADGVLEDGRSARRCDGRERETADSV